MLGQSNTATSGVLRSVETAFRGLILSVLSAATVVAQPSTELSAEDREAIQDLMAGYARSLAQCRAEEYADLFVPETGYFASGFRGHIAGRSKLIALVLSERHCLESVGANPAARPGSANGPTVEIEIVAGRVRGVADLGTAEYQDEYVKTALGWRFASRTVIVAAEKAAGLDADALLAITRLSGPDLGDYYEADENGVARLLSSGVRIAVTGDEITGRAYLSSGGYRDEVYERSESGQWRVESSAFVPPGQD